MFSLKHFLILSSLILCSIHSVISIKCYICHDYISDECRTNFSQEKFIRDCSVHSQFPFDASNGIFSNATAQSSSNSFGYLPPPLRSDREYRCSLMTYKYFDKVILQRDCIQRPAGCDDYKDKDITCKVCSGDLCNSSSGVKAGFYVLGSSLVVYTLFWQLRSIPL